MARSRNIKPGFAKNEFLAQKSMAARLLFAQLPTIADREGRLEDRPLRIKGEIFPYEAVDVHELLNDLAVSLPNQDHPFIFRYEEEGKKYIQIVKFLKNQSPYKDEKPSIIPPHKCTTTGIQLADNNATTGTLPTESGKEERGNRKQESERGESEGGETEGGASSNSPQFAFEAFWGAVHRKVGRRAAEKAYRLAVKRIDTEGRSVGSHAFLLERMQAFAASPAAAPTDREPIHPTTWLNQGRYDDDPATWGGRAIINQAERDKQAEKHAAQRAANAANKNERAQEDQQRAAREKQFGQALDAMEPVEYRQLLERAIPDPGRREKTPKTMKRDALLEYLQQQSERELEGTQR